MQKECCYVNHVIDIIGNVVNYARQHYWKSKKRNQKQKKSLLKKKTLEKKTKKEKTKRKISKKKNVCTTIFTKTIKKKEMIPQNNIPLKKRSSQRITEQNQKILKKQSLLSISQPILPLEIESITSTVSSSPPVSSISSFKKSQNMNQTFVSQFKVQEVSTIDKISVKKDYWYETDSEDEIMVSKTSKELCCITQEHREILQQMEHQIQNLEIETLDAEKNYEKQKRKYECATKNRERLVNELALLKMRLYYKKKLFLNFDL